MDWMPQAIREGILTILFISGPMVVLAAGLGLAIGVIQAATQVQEQTLGSAVKIIGIFIALIIFGFYMFQYMSRYATDSITKAFKLVPTLTAKAMPRRNFLEIPIQDKEVQVPVGTAAEGPQGISGGGSSGASKLAESLHEPGVETINENLKGDNKIAAPASQVRPIPDVERMKAQKLPATGSSTSNAQRPVTTTTTTAKTAPSKAAPVAKPAQTIPATNKPTPAPVAKPAQTIPAANKPTPAPAATKPVSKPAAPVITPAPVVEEPQAPPKALPRPALTGRLNQLRQEAATY